MVNVLYVLAALALVGLNAFFVATEFAIVKVRRTRIEELIADGVRSARAVRDVLDHLNDYLSACQLGITLASLGLGWIGEPAFAHLIEPLFAGLGDAQGVAAHSAAVTVAFLIITFLHVVLGEVVPKTLAIDRSEAMALLTAWPIRWFYKLFFPMIWFLNESSNVFIRMMGLEPVPEAMLAHSEEELRMLVSRSHQKGVLSDFHAKLLLRALDFADHTVRQIMVPRGDIVYLDLRRPLRENVRVALESGHTRFPLVDGDLDRLVGIVHLRDLLRNLMEAQNGKAPGEPDLRKLARPPLLVPESITIDKLLEQFQSRQMHLAVVLDEYGGTAGVVTLEDVIEELTGEIQDEFDRETPKVQALPDGSLRVDASIPLDEARELVGLDVDPEEEDVDTLGGLVVARLGRLASPGDEVEVNGRRIRVESMRGRRIEWVCIDAAAPGNGPSGSA